jgi:antigen flippase
MGVSSNVFSIFQRDLLLFSTNLITGVLIARILGPSALGIFGILSMVPAYAEGFGRIKVDIAAVYFIGKKKYLREEVYYNINLIALISSAIIVSVIILNFNFFYEWLFKNEEIDFRAYMFVILVQIPIHFLYMNLAYFHIATENIKIYNRMVVINALLNSIIALVLLFFTSFGLWSVIFSSVISISISFTYGFIFVDRSGWRKISFNIKIMLDLFRYGMNMYVGGIFGQFQQSGTQLLSVAFLVPAQIAFLNQGQGVGKLLNKFVDPLNTILFPRISNLEEEEAIILSCKAFRISLILLCLGGLGLFVLGGPLIALLYGKIFLPTVEVINFLLPGIILAGASSTLTNYFTGTGRASLIPKIQLLPLIIQLYLTWNLTQLCGLKGATISIMTASLIYGIILVHLFLRTSKTSINKLLPGITDLKYIYSFGKDTFKSFFKRGQVNPNSIF